MCLKENVLHVKIMFKEMYKNKYNSKNVNETRLYCTPYKSLE